VAESATATDEAHGDEDSDTDADGAHSDDWDVEDLSSFAHGLLTDLPDDERPCRRDCHGHYFLADPEHHDDIEVPRAVCTACRISYDGESVPPPTAGSDDEDDVRPRYDGSEKVRLAGGFAAPYDQTTDVGDGTDYEFDLSNY